MGWFCREKRAEPAPAPETLSPPPPKYKAPVYISPKELALRLTHLAGELSMDYSAGVWLDERKDWLFRAGLYLVNLPEPASVEDTEQNQGAGLVEPSVEPEGRNEQQHPTPSGEGDNP